MPTAFFLTKLRSGVSARDYEKWVQDVDYPAAKKVNSIESYRVCRINGALEGDKIYDYIEVVEITDMADFAKDFESEAMKKLLAEWRQYVGESVAVHGQFLSPA